MSDTMIFVSLKEADAVIAISNEDLLRTSRTPSLHLEGVLEAFIMATCNRASALLEFFHGFGQPAPDQLSSVEVGGMRAQELGRSTLLCL